MNKQREIDVSHKSFFLFALFSLIIWPICAQEVKKEKIVVNNDTIEFTLTGSINYLDGIIIPEILAVEKLMNDEIDGVEFRKFKEAVRYYGEKHRTGIILWESKHDKKDDEKENKQ